MNSTSVSLWNRILVALDKTPESMAAVEYLGSVLGGSASCRVHLLAVWVPPLRDNFPDKSSYKARWIKDKRALSTVLDKANLLLQVAGLPKENLTQALVVAKSGNVPKAIIRQQRKGGHGTIVLGRRNKSKAEEFLFGSVSSAVLHEVRDCCVWVVA